MFCVLAGPRVVSVICVGVHLLCVCACVFVCLCACPGVVGLAEVVIFVVE